MVISMLMVWGNVHAQYVAPDKVFDETMIARGGASVYMIDMSMGKNSNVEIFSIQNIKATPYPTNSLSGETIPQLSFGTSVRLPAGISDADVGKRFTSTRIGEVIEFTPITPTNIIYDSGMSRHVYTFKVDPSKYLFIKANNTGTSNFLLSTIMGMSRTGKDPEPVFLKLLTFNLTSTTGTSIFSNGDSSGVTVPAGTRYLLAQNSATSGVTVLYSHNRTTINNATATYIDAADRMVFRGSNEALRDISIKALGTTTLVVECWTGKPY